MEKISGILPGSPRVTSVDMRETAPVRPGTPGFGRPENTPAFKEVSKELGLSTAHKAINAHQDLNDWRTRDSKHALAAAELSNKFFVRNQKEAVETKSQKALEQPAFNRDTLLATAKEVASRPSGFKTDSSGDLQATRGRFASSAMFAPNEEVENQPELAQPEGLYPRGTFIDRIA